MTNTKTAMQKQTAVEWLVQEMVKPNLSMKDIFEQAKEMFKQQIIHAYEEGQRAEAKQEFWTKGNKHYEETYNKN